jgi:hypothetical protein
MSTKIKIYSYITQYSKKELLDVAKALKIKKRHKMKKTDLFNQICEKSYNHYIDKNDDEGVIMNASHFAGYLMNKKFYSKLIDYYIYDPIIIDKLPKEEYDLDEIKIIKFILGRSCYYLYCEGCPLIIYCGNDYYVVAPKLGVN